MLVAARWMYASSGSAPSGLTADANGHDAVSVIRCNSSRHSTTSQESHGVLVSQVKREGELASCRSVDGGPTSGGQQSMALTGLALLSCNGMDHGLGERAQGRPS